MITISARAIDSTLEETARAYYLGNLSEFHQSVRRRLRNEQPILLEYIDDGATKIRRRYEDDVSLIRGYTSGSRLAFRMIEAQLKMDKKSLKIKEADVESVNDQVRNILDENVSDIIMAKIEKIRRENREFGNYVYDYVTGLQAINEVAQGFGMGIVTTYSAYEECWKNKGF